MIKFASYFAEVRLDTKKAKKDLKNFDQTAKKGISGVVAGLNGKKLFKGLAIGGAIAIAAVAPFVKTAAMIQEGFIGVKKTTNLSNAEITKLKNNLLDFSTTAPVAITSLIEIAKVAGQLGIQGSANIEKFTKTFAKLEIASDKTVSGELGAQAFAKFLDLTGAGVENAENIASAIVEIGNTSKLTEGQLLSTALEVSKVARTFNIGAEAVLGLAATFTELAVQPEVARSSTNKFFNALNKAVLDKKGIEEFKKITGLTAEELEDFSKTSPELVLLAFAKGLKKAKDEQISLTTELKALKLNGERVDVTLKALSSSTDTFENQLKKASNASIQNTALNKEAEIAGQSFNASLIKLKNSISQLGDAIAGSGVLAGLTKFVDGLIFITKGATDAAKAVGDLIGLMGREGVVFSGEEDLSSSRRQFNRQQAIGFGRNVDSGQLSDLIDRDAPILKSPLFIQEIQKRGLLEGENLERLREQRSSNNLESRNQSLLDTFNKRGIQSNTPGQQQTITNNNSVTVNAPITESGSPEQTARAVKNTVSANSNNLFETGQ